MWLTPDGFRSSSGCSLLGSPSAGERETIPTEKWRVALRIRAAYVIRRFYYSSEHKLHMQNMDHCQGRRHIFDANECEGLTCTRCLKGNKIISISFLSNTCSCFPLVIFHQKCNVLSNTTFISGRKCFFLCSFTEDFVYVCVAYFQYFIS